jgi:cathepsin L
LFNAKQFKKKTGPCRYNPYNSVTTLSGYVDLPRGDEKALTQAVANIGPISVAIDASQPSFQLYKSGIYNDFRCSPYNLDHAVVVVGYGTENNQDYYIGYTLYLD